MMSEHEVYGAYLNWNAALRASRIAGDVDGARLAQGFVGALEMVLQIGRKDSGDD